MREHAMSVQNTEPEWLDIMAACEFIGGTRPINPATFYRGVKAGRYPAAEQRGHNVKRVSREKLAAALQRLAAPSS